MRPVRVLLGIVILAATFGCSTHHQPPTLSKEVIPSGTRASYAGVALTIPRTWHVVSGGPRLCQPYAARTAYFYVQSSSPAPGCSVRGTTTGYILLVCPYKGEPQSQPAPELTQLGGFTAHINREVGPPGGDDAGITLKGDYPFIEIYGRPQLVGSVEASIRKISGSC